MAAPKVRRLDESEVDGMAEMKECCSAYAKVAVMDYRMADVLVS